MLVTILLPMLLGGVSGVVGLLVANKNVLQKPQRITVGKKVFYNIGWLGDFIIGALAGVAAVNLIVPEGEIGQIVAIAILGGINGGVFLKKNALAKEENSEIDAKVKKLLELGMSSEKDAAKDDDKTK